MILKSKTNLNSQQNIYSFMYFEAKLVFQLKKITDFIIMN